MTRWQIGDARITAVVEQALQMDGLITAAKPETLAEIARADWATVADYDRTASTDTRKPMLEDLAGNGALMLGTHFAEPTGGRIVRDGETWKLDV